MAKYKGLTAVIDLDASKFSKNIKKAFREGAASTKSMRAQLRSVNAALKQTGTTGATAMHLLHQKQDLYESAVKRSRNEQALLRKEIDRLMKSGHAFDEIKTEVTELQAKLNYAKASEEKYNRALQNTKREATIAERSLTNMGRAVNTLSSKMSQAKERSAAFNSMLGNLAADGLWRLIDMSKRAALGVANIGMSFEESQSKVKALSGASAEEMEQLEGAARKLGETTVYTAQQVSEAESYFALAGWDTEEILAGLSGTLNLALSSQMDIADATSIVTDNLKAFGLTAQDTSHFVDVLAYAQANSNTTTSQLSEAYKYVAATAASMGYSVEDTTAALMVLSNQGIKGSEAGSGLRTMMIRLATNTSHCQEALHDYGVEVYDNNGKLRKFTDVLNDMSGVWETLGDEEKAALSKKVAGVYQYTKLQAVMAGVSEEAINSGRSISDFSDALENCDGAAQNTADTMTDNLASDVKIASAAAQEAALKMYDAFSGEARDAIQDVPNLLADISPELVTMAEGFAGAIPVIEDMVIAVVNLSQDLPHLAAGIAGFVTALKVLSITSGPVGLAIAGVSALVGLIALATGEFGDFERETDNVSSKIESMKSAQDSVNESAFETVEQAKSQVEHYQELADKLDDIVDKKGKVKDGHEEEAQVILDTLNPALGTNAKLVDGQIDGYDKLKSSIESAIESMRAQSMLAAYQESYQSALKDKSSHEQAMADAYASQAEALKNLVDARAAYNDADQNGNVFQRSDAGVALNEAQKAFDDATSSYHSAAEMLDKDKTIIESYEQAYSSIQGGDFAKATETLDGLGTSLQQTGDDSSAAADSLSSLGGVVENLAVQMGDAYASGNEEMFFQLKTSLYSAVEEYRLAGGKFSGALAEGISKSDEPYQAGNKVVQNITDMVRSTADSMTEYGAHIANNLASSMASEASLAKLRDASSKMAAAASSSTKHSVPKEGPMKDDDKWGAHMVDNLIVGMMSKKRELSLASSDIASTIVSGYGSIATGYKSESDAIVSRSLDGAVEAMSSNGIDYGKMGAAMAGAMSSVSVNIDSTKVASVTAPSRDTVDGRIRKLAGRGLDI